MFTGIVETLGRINNVSAQPQGLRMEIAAPLIAETLTIGASIAVNGVCLTVVAFTDGSFTVDVVAETLRCSNLSLLRSGSAVNLERPLRADGRFDGHIVQGHVDATVKLTALTPEGNAYLATFAAEKNWLGYIVPKGYVALDGMSITVIDVLEDGFTVTFIPHTYAITRAQYYQPGDLINLEVDILGKYIKRLIK